MTIDTQEHLIAMQRASSTIYLACHAEIAAEISELLLDSIDIIEQLESENTELFRVGKFEKTI